jgi:hypothetical protein
MNKIKTKVSREANYIYHMLSVSKCGYDNEYGNKYSNLYNHNDLFALKKMENLITVSGGEHCGQLYWPLISIPASLDSEAAEYYKMVHKLFTDENNLYVKENYSSLYSSASKGFDTIDEYLKYKNEILSICDIMIHNYQKYCNEIWLESQKELEIYASDMQQIFDNSNICSRLESATGLTMNKTFIASFCNSLENGPEAIDISETQDIFGIARDYEMAKSFISHEYIIYLLREAILKNGLKFDITYWNYFESLAEYYNSYVVGNSNCFNKPNNIIDFYISENADGKYSAIELYKKAIERYTGEKLL